MDSSDRNSKYLHQSVAVLLTSAFMLRVIKIRASAPTVPGPRPALRPEHTNVAMDPAEVLRQAGVSVSREVDFGPALPFTMGVVGSDSEFQDCASPTASASRLMSAFSD